MFESIRIKLDRRNISKGSDRTSVSCLCVDHIYGDHSRGNDCAYEARVLWHLLLLAVTLV